MAKFRPFSTLGAFVALLLACPILSAQAARFDLTGPKLEIHVTRDGKTLPIASVPNLQAGDKIWLHPDLPTTQSVHYLLVVCFLRGTTNPPPDDWFIKIQTWNQKVREEGVSVYVPDEAQQVVLFLAPETGGDFTTLRSAVRGRPGIFVRASQDLAEAGFEQARIEKYLADMRLVPPSDPKALLEHSNLIARTLNLKPNEDCFNRPVDQQYTCLTQSGNQTLLNDGHGETVVSSLTNGDASNLINQASYTGLGGGGAYSAYVGAVVDLVHIMGNLHTAQYQYIPAIAFPEGESLNLRLNTPPSFHNPKSVIVIGLPAVQASVPPPLRPADPKHVTCLVQPSVALPVEGAPLVFSTSFAHNLVLHVNDGGATKDIPLVPDAYRGGLTLAPDTGERKLLTTATTDAPQPAPVSPTKVSAKPDASGKVTGTITGYWGFDPFTGPTMQLQTVPGKGWKLAADDVLIAGRENNLSLSSSGTACVQSITLDTSAGKQDKTDWKEADKPNLIDVKVSLKSVDPGALHLTVHQYGEPKPDIVSTETFSEPATLSSLKFYAGDTSAVLNGTNLNQVAHLDMKGLIFTPAPLPSSNTDGFTEPQTSGTTSLRLALPANTGTPKLKEGEKLTAHVTLKDGRTLTLPVEVAPGRPSVTLINKRIAQSADNSIHLADTDDLPVTQQLTFSLKSEGSFPRTGEIEIANADNSLHTTLSVAAGTLIMQNHHTLVGMLDPLKAFGTSAFGPLRLRAVDPNGTAGDWIPLITLVRLPALDDVHCPSDSAQPCTVTGSSLYLVDSIATDAGFTNPTDVPEGFIGTTLSLPRPSKSGFYLKLRDDPTAANIVTIPVSIQRPPQSQRAQKVAPPVKPETTTPAATPDETPAETPPTKDASPAAPADPGHPVACTQGTCPPPEQPAAQPGSSPPAKS
ncbi:hypothetical protein [Edaphobacter dinghuensis]|uniref:Uncharacterized protein n=2 Tax=Edaphobacter dinghuensis TaxID=1560005 RepID=A0A917HCA6_9BACT|nr:hypothetical protein [Edaphobacter dinghuensis]GGG74301.1 hypothetical protein GCM10011585_16140 [Edaphobacter dinghuensis]